MSTSLRLPAVPGATPIDRDNLPGDTCARHVHSGEPRHPGPSTCVTTTRIVISKCRDKIRAPGRVAVAHQLRRPRRT
jgi:hypothetical protein